MSKPIPSIQKFMTTSPHTIGEEQTMALAHRMMHDNGIRHLPVLRNHKVVGLVSDRDLHFVEALKDVDPKVIKVSEAMSQDPYVVSPETPLDEVVAMMASNKLGSAIVAQNEHVVGIFTTVDACWAFAEMLYTRLGKS